MGEPDSVSFLFGFPFNDESVPETQSGVFKLPMIDRGSEHGLSFSGVTISMQLAAK